jgi:predicted CXXCH cytochrome family protein
MVCGQCHSRGRAKGGATAFCVGFQPGGDLEAAFDDAKPQAAGRNQQYSDLRQSPKHWDAGVVCEKCHDPHGDTDQPYQLRLSIDDTCLQCHKDKVKSLEEHVKDKGKTAPAGATCATCHMPGGRHLFDKTLADG